MGNENVHPLFKQIFEPVLLEEPPRKKFEPVDILEWKNTFMELLDTGKYPHGHRVAINTICGLYMELAEAYRELESKCK